MLLDQLADVVTLGFEGQARKRAGHRDTRREGRIFIYRESFLVPRYGHDTLSGSRQHRATLAQVVEIGVRIGDKGRVGEEIDRFEITQKNS